MGVSRLAASGGTGCELVSIDASMVRLTVILIVVAALASVPAWAAENTGKSDSMVKKPMPVQSTATKGNSNPDGSPAAKPAGPTSAAARVKLAQVERINDEIRKGWVDRGCGPRSRPPMASGAAACISTCWAACRRVDELNKFISDKSNRKRTIWSSGCSATSTTTSMPATGRPCGPTC